MTRLDNLFQTARDDARTVFLPFMTAGLPTPEVSPAVFRAMLGAGADGCELGIPYSDPLMDGPIIQRGSDMAIASGTTIDRSLEIMKSVSSDPDKVVIAMTYANPIFRRGVDVFCEQLAAAGAAGVIVPDLPVEESGPLVQACARHGIGTVQFVAPTSHASRIEQVVAARPSFIYAIAEMGVTGERSESSGHVATIVGEIRAITDIPIVFGVGIGSPHQAVAARRSGADGVIVGSAMVRAVLDCDEPEAIPEVVADLVGRYVAALNG